MPSRPLPLLAPCTPSSKSIDTWEQQEEASWRSTETRSSPAPISHPHHQKDQRNGTFAGLTAADTVAQEEKKCRHLKQLHGALGGSQWLLSLGKRCEGFLPACPGRVSKWKRCAACGQTLPIPTYFGDSDKELEETHTLPLGGQQSGDLLFQSLTGTLFPPLSLPLAATCVFVTALFCSSSTKRSGWDWNRKGPFSRKGQGAF